MTQPITQIPEGWESRTGTCAATQFNKEIDPRHWILVVEILVIQVAEETCLKDGLRSINLRVPDQRGFKYSSWTLHRENPTW